MNRDVFARCALFRSMSHREISMLMGCLGMRYRRILAGTSMYTDRFVVVLSGNVTVQTVRYSAGSLIISNGKSQHILAQSQSEILLINRTKIFSLCKNACAPHQKAIYNLMCMYGEASSRRIDATGL